VFLTLQNAGTAARTLVSGRASVGDTLELHEMKRENGMMRMAPVPGIAIPAGATVELRPGGLHLMLFGLKKPLVAGDTVRVQLTLDDKTTVEVAAPVRRMGGM
jgi:copper(I)-binding protein